MSKGAKKMLERYTREQFWRLFQKLPQELREVMLAPETGDDIENSCKRNGIDESLTSKVAEYTGYVLLGVLPPEDFQKILQKEVGLKNSAAKNVAQEIYRHIFFPVREQLNELYKVDIAARLAKPSVRGRPAEPAGAAPAEELAEPAAPAEVPAPAQARPAKPKKPDTYREPLE